jgi:DNA-binding GntR family transcriptional regulator
VNEPQAGQAPARPGLASRPLVNMVRRPSTVDLITVELRHAIYSGSLRPGEAVREAEVASQLGVSRGPLRESAQRLVQEGLLVARPGAGLRVVTIGPERVGELYQARLAIEGAAVRLLAALEPGERGERLEALEALWAALEAACTDGTDASRIGDADLDLHFGLVEAAGNALLVAFASTLTLQTRIAALSHPDGYVVRTDILEVHRTLLDQISAGFGDAAVATLRGHFEQAVDRLHGTLSGPFNTVSSREVGAGFHFNRLP